MNAIHEALSLIKKDRKVFNLINIGYFATIIIGMLIIHSNPKLQEQLLALVGNAFSSGPMQYLTGAYTNGEIINAIGLTFIINLVVGSFIAITLPSLIIPFSGFVIGAYRALVWGLLFSPDMTGLDLSKVIMGIGIGLLLIFEGEAYVLGLFAAFLQSRAWVKPALSGAENHRQGYLAGIRLTIRIYLLVIGMLLIAAIYEVVLVVLILPLLV
jgi:hypothetical protein